MVRSNLCDYSDAYIHVKGTIEVTNKAADEVAPNNRDKKVTLKNCAPFISCISRINDTQVDDAHDIDVVMPMYKLIEYKKYFIFYSKYFIRKYREVYGNLKEMNQL